MYETTLSGDLLGDDGPLGSWQNYADNSLHIATINDAQATSLIEGLTFYGSNHNTSLENSGGALLCNGGVPRISNCQIRGNSSYRGAVALVNNSQGQATDCVFYENRACHGGAFAASNLFGDQSRGIITHCQFAANTLYCGGSGTGTAIVGPCEITDCDFIGNFGFQASVGTIGGSPDTTVVRCRFQENYADSGAGIAGSVWCEDSQFIQNAADTGAAYSGGGGAGMLKRCTFIQNVASQWGGAVESPSAGAFGVLLIDSIFDRNVAVNLSGGAVQGKGDFINCVFLRNDCWWFGGSAVYVNDSATLMNCLAVGNTCSYPGADASGAIHVPLGNSATIINSTVVHNLSPDSTGGVFAGGTVTIDNSVLWNNRELQALGSASIRYSCVQGGWNGPGNIDIEPRFVNTASDDYRLRPGSPCIDGGDSSAVPPDAFDLNGDGDFAERVPVDLLGQPRFRNNMQASGSGTSGGTGLPVVDMGAFEFQPLADTNVDGLVNVVDLINIINSWGPCPGSTHCSTDISPYPNGDGVVDFHDLLAVLLSWGQ